MSATESVSKLNLSLEDVMKLNKKKKIQERKANETTRNGPKLEKKAAVAAKSVGEKKANRQAEVNKKRGINESGKPKSADIKKTAEKQLQKAKKQQNNNGNNSSSSNQKMTIRVNRSEIFKMNKPDEVKQIKAAYAKKRPQGGKQDRLNAKAIGGKNSSRQVKSNKK